MTRVFHDLGITFQYPADWSVEVSEDGARTTIEVNSQSGGYAMIAMDEDLPEPRDTLSEALEAMRAEYPDLESTPRRETIGGYPAFGHDLEFFSLDLVVNASVRCFQTSRYTVLVLSQWLDHLEDDAEGMGVIRGSLQES